ncbi:MAG TPA: nuclear transport factor 2 family protein, partial [Vicinamibacterales bacterium]|nr:nuclear transport factor 2 family protein [Vicinamibacterales bacterium]
KQIVQAFYDAGNRGDMDACLALLSDDVRWTNIGSTPFSGTYVGKKDLLERLLGPVFGQLQAGIASTIHNVIAENDYVAVQSSGVATTKDGRPYNNTYCHVFRIAGGRICEVTEYLDTDLLRSVLAS